MQFNCVLLFLISFLFLHCSGQHIAHHGRHYTHAKRQIATNATDVKASLTPVKAENLSFFSDAPENFLMRQPWSAENDTEAQFHLKFAPALDLVSTTAATTDDYTCSANKPCRDHAACCNGVSGQCGFGPDFCGADVCISDCDAKAECGQYAVEGKEECPLKVCCSKWGFCGTTTDFCGDGCQGNCGDPKPSGRRARDPRGRIIAYYEAWSPSKACGNMEPEDIPVEGLTHLNFAFAYITPNTYHIVPMDSRTPEDMFTRVTSAKERNPDLKVFVALGGWTFSDNGTETQAVFPNLVKTGPSRSRFISNLIAFMSQYGFDGVDIDWEYPGAGDRGGTPDDPKNFVLLTKELRSAFDGEGKGWEITFTVPTSYWYLRWFDVHGMAQWVHWINVMSYDLHGNWDKNNPIGSIVNPHTNLTEIDEALKLLWRVGIAPEQIVLGIAFYGRSFQLANGGCTKPGCAFAGPAAKGICTGEEGILSYLEIQNLLDRTRAKPTYDQAAGIQYVVFNGNQWVSYDDSKTIKQKVDFAQKYGLSGLMTWAIDLDDGKSSLLKAMTGKSFNSNGGLRAGTQFPIGEGGPRDSSSLSSKCIVTECRNGGEMYCPNGYLFQTHLEYMGEAYSEEMDCPGNKQRSLCCPADHNPDRAKCSWTDCGGACASGEAYLVSDWVGDNPNTACSPRTGNYFRNYCCQIENMDQYFDSCMYSACSEEPKCGEKGMEEYTEELATAYHWTEKGKELCPLDRTFCQDSNSGDCPKEKSVKFCCKPKKVKSCKWKGTPEGAGIHTDYDTCMFNECVGGEIVMDRAYKGDDSRKSCFSHSPKNLCCIPGEDAEENWDIDPANLVPYDLREGDDIEVDSHVSASTPSTADFISFMSVIGNKQDVISLDKRDGSHLEFFDCKPLPGKQTVKVICTNTAEGSNCHDIHEGGLPGTVVRLPEGCGRSPWARAVSMTESQDQALTKRLVKRGLPPDAKVHEFTFDYDFTLIKRDAGKIAFRIDQSNLDNYWNNVVDSPPDDFENVPAKKRSEREELRDFFANQTDDSGLHMKRPHELYSQYKRWWGDLPGDYAFKATSGDAGGFERSLEFTIAEFDYGFRDEITCTYGSNKYKAVGEINTLGKVTGKIKFGATMYGELWPNFSFRNSYVYMRGEMKGDFALDVTSDNVWDYTSDNMQFGQRFRLPKTNYAIDGIGEIYLYAGARGSATAKGEWSGNINIPWKWQTETISLTVPSTNEVPDEAGFEREGLGAGATITPTHAQGNDKLQMAVSIKPYVGLGFAVGAGNPSKKGSDFTHIAGVEMETEIRSVMQVVHNSDLKEVCIHVYGQVGVNGVAISPLARWSLGKDTTQYALWHSELRKMTEKCFPTGEVGKRRLPRGIPTTPVNQAGEKNQFSKRASGISCRNDKSNADQDLDCSKCLADNGFAAHYTPDEQVLDTDLCDNLKRDESPQRPKTLAIFLRNETTIDNATLHAPLDKRAVTTSEIEDCSLQWTSAKYDSCSVFQKKTGKYYYDDKDQKSCTDFRVVTYSKPQRSGKGMYATEHVYELNFIKEFLEFLRSGMYYDKVKEDRSKYMGFSCSDLTDTFFIRAGGTPTIDRIMAALGNRDKQDLLAILFKDINGMKFRALAGEARSSIVGDNTWKKSTFREKYAHLKKLGGVGSYMKTPEIEKMFVSASNGVYDVLGNTDKKWKLQARYALWMDHLILSYNTEMKRFLMDRSVELHNAHTGGGATGYSSQEVANLNRMGSTGTPVGFDMWWKPSGLKK